MNLASFYGSFISDFHSFFSREISFLDGPGVGAAAAAAAALLCCALHRRHLKFLENLCLEILVSHKNIFGGSTEISEASF